MFVDRCSHNKIKVAIEITSSKEKILEVRSNIPGGAGAAAVPLVQTVSALLPLQEFEHH